MDAGGGEDARDSGNSLPLPDSGPVMRTSHPGPYWKRRKAHRVGSIVHAAEVGGWKLALLRYLLASLNTVALMPHSLWRSDETALERTACIGELGSDVCHEYDASCGELGLASVYCIAT